MVNAVEVMTCEDPANEQTDDKQGPADRSDERPVKPPLLKAGQVVTDVNLADQPTWGTKIHWLTENGLWDGVLTQAELERGYKVFADMIFGDCGWQPAKEDCQDLVGMECMFATEQDNIGCVSNFAFSLKVRPGTRIKQARLSPDERAFVKKKMQQLLRKGVVGYTEDGAYLHRIVLVKGHADRPSQYGQQYHLCTDFRAVNERTLEDGFPAPDLQECLCAVGNVTCCSSMDWKAGFRNIPIEQASQRLMGVVMQDGTYQYNRLQLGLSNAPPFFQRVAVTIKDKGDVKVIIYLDDIVVYVNDPIDVWQETVVVLQRLTSARFMINTAKSQFLVSKLKMLGYNVGSGSISPRFPYLQALVGNKRAPQTVRDVQALYRLLSYFHAFVPNFTQLAAPVSALLQGGGEKRQWTKKHDRIVPKVHWQLVQHSGLKVPNLGQPFILEVACRGNGYGSVLLQADEAKRLARVGCVSMLKQRAVKSDVEQTLPVTLYCLRKFAAIL